MSDWRLLHWLPAETDFEHAERVENADALARKYFDDATAPQREAYSDRMADLAPYRGPKWERARGDALRYFREATSEAAQLFEFTAEEILRDGEVSEETSMKWDLLTVRAQMLDAAE
jgi:hypothetical protein